MADNIQSPSNGIALPGKGIVLRARLRLAEFTLDLDLTLPGHGVTGLFGHSGSGKTTCLRMMAGLIKPDRGYLNVNGETWLDTDKGIDLPTHRRAIGYVFQEPSLFAHMNVRRNLEYGSKRVPASQRRVDMAHMTALLGIDGLLARMPQSLSGGEQQRVGIARALLTSPQLLLMDEPLAALDLKRKREILPYLQRLHDELDIPVIYVSHAPDEMARLADHLVVLQTGRVVASGPIVDTLAQLDLPDSDIDIAHLQRACPLEDFTVNAPHDFDVRFRLRVRQGDAIAMGPGKIDLLEAIKNCGSISAGARSLGMSYRRAWMLLEELNASLACPATLSEQGGARGGGSALTPVGEEIIARYRAIEQQAQLACAADIARLTSLLK